MRLDRANVLRAIPFLAFAAVFTFFAASAPSFLAPANLVSMLVNNFALLAMVALGMTAVLWSGGIDLSVGTSIDVASLVCIALLASRTNVGLAILGGIGAALIVGAVNAFLIARLNITPFLATLGTLFIGQSVQQLATNGGQPIYLITGNLPVVFTTIGQGHILGIPIPLCIVALSATVFSFLLNATGFGRSVLALGAQPLVAWYSGLNVRRDTAIVYFLSAGICGVAGITLSATIKAYVPLSGNAYMLDAIGASFIGTTLSAQGRPSILGTLLGVLFLSVISNGLLLIGWTFPWQNVGTGVVIFLVLALSYSSRRLAAGR